MERRMTTHNERLVQVSIGPPIPKVPIADFERMKVSSKDMIGVWRIIGPSVALHSKRDYPLWKVITLAYMEGLTHGYQLGCEQESDRTGVESGSKGGFESGASPSPSGNGSVAWANEDFGRY